MELVWVFERWTNVHQAMPLLKPGYSYVPYRVHEGSMATVVLWKHNKSAVGWLLGLWKLNLQIFDNLSQAHKEFTDA